jgi:phage/plasmid-associated DNA primase
MAMQIFREALSKYSSSDEITHVHYGDFNGSYNIPEAHLKNVYDFICKKAKAGVFFSLVEKPPANKIKPFMIDLDLKYENENQSYTMDEVQNFCIAFAEAVLKVCDFKVEEVRMIIQTRDGYVDPKSGKFKNGIHIVIPDLVCSTRMQKIIRKIMIESNDWNFDNNLNSKDETYDYAVIETAGFFVYGCGKANLPVYEITDCFQFYIDSSRESEGLDTCCMDLTVDNIHKLRQRGYEEANITVSFKPDAKLPELEEDKPKPQPKLKLIKLNASAKLEAKPTQLSEAESSEYIYLLNNINKSRFDEHSSWLKIAFLLKSSGVSFDWFDHFSKTSEKYPGRDELLVFWNNLKLKENANPITIATLYAWLKEDNIEEYEKIQKLEENLIKYTEDSDFADFYYEIIKHNNKMQKYIFNTKSSCWFYIMEDNIWYATEKAKDPPPTLKHDIKMLIRSIFKRKSSFYEEEIKKLSASITNLTLDLMKDSKNKIALTEMREKKNELDQTLKKINDIVSDAGSAPRAHRITQYLIMHFTNNNINLASFNLPHIFAFNNVLFDMTVIDNKIVGFRPIEPKDMVLHTTGYDYIFEDLATEKNDLINYIYSLFDKKDVADFQLRNLAHALNGSMEGAQYFNINTGSSSNGKSMLYSFLLTCFGQYGTSLRPTFLTEKVKDPSNANLDLYGLMGIRLAVASEISENDKLEIKVIKSITGHDEQTARKQYGDAVKFMPQCHLALLCNALPHFYDSSNAMSRRNIVVNFPYTFGKEDDGQYRKLADYTLESKFKQHKYKVAMMQIFIDVYEKNYVEDIKIRDIPESVLQYTQEYNSSNDEVVIWFNQNYEVNGDMKSYVGSSQLFSEFKTSTLSALSQIQFTNSMKNKTQATFKRTSTGRNFYGIVKKEITNQSTEIDFNKNYLSNKSE